MLIKKIHGIILAPCEGSKRMYCFSIGFPMVDFLSGYMVKVIASEIILKLYVFSLFHSAKKSGW